MIPHLALPFVIGHDGTAAVVVQDSIEDVVQSVQVLLGTVPGQRIELPAYGVPDQTFTDRPDPAPIMAALEQWEPRAAVALSMAPVPDDELRRLVTARVAVR